MFFVQTNNMGFLSEARKMQKQLVAWRRYLHENAEVGFELTKTTSFIENELKKLGYKPKNCGKAGVVATVGKGARTFLLRADTDGLPIEEKTGKRFACKYGHMHACGHDMHAAMLLGAAKLLKERESDLKGQVKFLFQPAEEILEGAKNVMEAGVLKGVDGAMMFHVLTNVELPVGTIVIANGISAPAADYFTIQAKGKSCHGSTPWKGVDALTAAARILLALQDISARELVPATPFVLSVGSFHGGVAGNVIADCAFLKGTLRSFDEETRELVKKRIEEIAKGVAKTFHASANVIYEGGCPTLINDEKTSDFAERVGRDMLGKNVVFNSKTLGGDIKEKSGGSEDFAYISHEVPSVMAAIAAGETSKGYAYPLHHPKVDFDEDALCVGAAFYAKVAFAIHQGEFFKKA